MSLFLSKWGLEKNKAMVFTYELRNLNDEITHNAPVLAVTTRV